jgi:hypothetical protein
MPSLYQIRLLAAQLAFLAFVCACGDGDGMPLERDGSAATRRDGGRSGFDADIDIEDDEPIRPTFDAGPDDEEDSGDDAAEAADADEPDADQADADQSDAAGCAEDQPADACGVCGGDGASCAHPLAGRYAVRTQLYTRQKAVAEGTELDLVSKGVLISIADIDAQGAVHEHYCLLELASVSQEGVFTWTVPSAVQRIPDTTVPLVEQEGQFVRPLSAHKAYFSWSPQSAPADCVAGQRHATGCVCPSGSGLPMSADDCRVGDIDQDGVPGGAMYIGFAPVEDPSLPGAELQLNLALQFGLEWRLDPAPGTRLVGDIAGGLDQAVLSLSGSFASSFGAIKNAVCPLDLGHVELVKGDFSCASLLAGRAENRATYGVFETLLDAEAPDIEECADPDCGVDSDRDGRPDCEDDCPGDAAKTAAGACGCGVADTNTDGDAAPDCSDGCPSDPAKLAAGACGCGTSDTNADNDSAPDCTDECDSDANKTAAGACGCGTPDTNTDNDSAPDCTDECDNDPAKTAPGTCGCGTSDTNTDNDSAPDCTDECDSDAAKTAPGTCGCGVTDEDRDGDGLAACNDACPDDRNKTTLGLCGCGVADTNTDNDSAPDCTDECDSDASKTAAGACGCGNAETDSDGDGTPNCTDECDSDRNKTAPGVCGCGVADTNSDGDSQPDCREECDTDPAKTAPGVCGCGAPDRDLNGDGSIDCSDTCPNDPAKLAPGVCGCGVPDTNSDGDSLPNCTDQCDDDRNKTVPGQCGCGVADADPDGDGVASCNDACPNDRNKTTLGLCGCGVADTNTDNDAAPDCTDECDSDRNKTTAGACGCGVADTNTDGDSAPDCTDQCDNDRNKTAPGACGCGVADTNTDNDSAPDCTDECDNDPTRTAAGPCGCMDCQTSPMAGTYAVRAVTFSKSRDASSVLTTKSLGYSLITITENTDRSLRLSERACWTQALPRPGDATQAYSWSKPAWSQALPLSEQTLTNNNNGTFTRSISLTHLGWDPARQPGSCSASSAPVAPWPSGWGSTCRCSTPATALPPYDINAAPYDCRLTDVDGDGQPGISAIAATSAPSSPDANAPALGGTAYAAIDARGSWLITQASDRRHTATINDTSEAQVVGCTGLACSFLTATPPPSRTCPQATTRVQFIPTTTSFDTCAEIIDQRSTLWNVSQDPAFPDTSACANP